MKIEFNNFKELDHLSKYIIHKLSGFEKAAKQYLRSNNIPFIVDEINYKVSIDTKKAAGKVNDKLLREVVSHFQKMDTERKDFLLLFNIIEK